MPMINTALTAHAPLALTFIPSDLRKSGQATTVRNIRPAGTIKRDTSDQKSNPASYKAQSKVPINTNAKTRTADDL